jgi:hypothetical protein
MRECTGVEAASDVSRANREWGKEKGIQNQDVMHVILAVSCLISTPRPTRTSELHRLLMPASML